MLMKEQGGGGILTEMGMLANKRISSAAHSVMCSSNAACIPTLPLRLVQVLPAVLAARRRQLSPPSQLRRSRCPTQRTSVGSTREGSRAAAMQQEKPSQVFGTLGMRS